MREGKKMTNFKGLCHILLLLLHPARGQQRGGVKRPDWLTGRRWDGAETALIGRKITASELVF